MIDFVEEIITNHIDYSEIEHINDTLNNLFPDITQEEFNSIAGEYYLKDLCDPGYMYNSLIDGYYKVPLSYEIVCADLDEKSLSIKQTEIPDLDELEELQISIKKLKEDGWKVRNEDNLLGSIDFWKDVRESFDNIRKKYGFIKN